MILFRGAPEQADDGIGRDLPLALRRAAASLEKRSA
jgi:ribonuclease P protein component